MQKLSFLFNELNFYSILEEKFSSCNASIKSKKTKLCSNDQSLESRNRFNYFLGS